METDKWILAIINTECRWCRLGIFSGRRMCTHPSHPHKRWWMNSSCSYNECPTMTETKWCPMDYMSLKICQYCILSTGCSYKPQYYGGQDEHEESNSR